ncbi:MAG: UDP-N-acetylglucosamine 2-epimerase (non-hydrolyzing) [Candidatus Magasanikbacteria bacterium]|nr:UDP-N-acetylglucosamine 2-epimerase (non-hydrolyzing) [Candidatus Magasanikbacteria bacterium]
MKKTIFIVAAARPNFIKIAPFYKHISKFPDLTLFLIHTGQHYDYNMSDTFFNTLDIPTPDVHLNIGSGSHAEQMGKTMIAFEQLCLKHQPCMVLVFGDVNATAACAITAKKCLIPVAHVEAGLRSFDREMPEEINRILTDSISDILYTTAEDAQAQLLKEGIPKANILFVGNVMIDTLFHHLDQSESTHFYETLNLKKKEYSMITLHRPSNVDNPSILHDLVNVFIDIATFLPVVFSVHPRTKKQLQSFDFYEKLNQHPNITLLEPIGYLENINLVANSRLVLTDSGGLQEETTALNIPCLTLRRNTERPVTISHGSNRLVGVTPKRILKEIHQIIDHTSPKYPTPSLWDGQASHRILKHLNTWLN